MEALHRRSGIRLDGEARDVSNVAEAGGMLRHHRGGYTKDNSAVIDG